MAKVWRSEIIELLQLFFLFDHIWSLNIAFSLQKHHTTTLNKENKKKFTKETCKYKLDTVGLYCEKAAVTTIPAVT